MDWTNLQCCIYIHKIKFIQELNKNSWYGRTFLSKLLTFPLKQDFSNSHPIKKRILLKELYWSFETKYWFLYQILALNKCYLPFKFPLELKNFLISEA